MESLRNLNKLDQWTIVLYLNLCEKNNFVRGPVMIDGKMKYSYRAINQLICTKLLIPIDIEIYNGHGMYDLRSLDDYECEETVRKVGPEREYSDSPYIFKPVE